MHRPLIDYIRTCYPGPDDVPLHAPLLSGGEKDAVASTIESTFVSSVGKYVTEMEGKIATYTGSPAAVATVNGTASLHLSLVLSGVVSGDLVITQSLTFVATCNAIRYCGADPVFVDVDRDTMGMSPSSLEAWLSDHAELDDTGSCVLKGDGRRIKACVPMHTFGHPVRIAEIVDVARKWNITVIEDAAESLGSFVGEQHTGTFGEIGVLSFNGNKIVTCGGGGMIVTSEEIGGRAKHLSTTAKVSHAYEYVHDEIGYNYRMPNINAALGCAQLERLSEFLRAKRKLAEGYKAVLEGSEYEVVWEPDGCRSNFWLNAVICQDIVARDALLEETNSQGIGTRPIWRLMHTLPMFESNARDDLEQSLWLVDRVVNLPSSVSETLLA